jgi:hypothetical protein
MSKSLKLKKSTAELEIYQITIIIWHRGAEVAQVLPVVREWFWPNFCQIKKKISYLCRIFYNNIKV